LRSASACREKHSLTAARMRTHRVPLWNRLQQRSRSTRLVFNRIVTWRVREPRRMRISRAHLRTVRQARASAAAAGQAFAPAASPSRLAPHHSRSMSIARSFLAQPSPRAPLTETLYFSPRRRAPHRS
jgi:hypothetical protein